MGTFICKFKSFLSVFLNGCYRLFAFFFFFVNCFVHFLWLHTSWLYGFAFITSITATCFAAAKVTTTREESGYWQEKQWWGLVQYLLFLAFSCPSSDDSSLQFDGGSEPKALNMFLLEIFIFLDCYKVAFGESTIDTMYCTEKTE